MHPLHSQARTSRENGIPCSKIYFRKVGCVHQEVLQESIPVYQDVHQVVFLEKQILCTRICFREHFPVFGICTRTRTRTCF